MEPRPTCLKGERAPPASPSTVPPRWSSSPSSAASSTSTAAAAAVVGVRGSAVARHLDAQLAAVQQRAIHGVHRVLGVALVVEAHEGEAAALLGVPVPRDVHVPDSAVLLEHPAQGLWLGPVREVVHFEGSHAVDVWRRPTVTHGGGPCAGPCGLSTIKLWISALHRYSLVFASPQQPDCVVWVELTRMWPAWEDRISENTTSSQ